MQVFGYMRFSYLGRSDARMSRDPEANNREYFERLFDPARLETRFHFFEKICLPAVKAQSDQDFTLFIMASETMPEVYKARLEAAVADIPQIDVRYSDLPYVVRAFAPVTKEATRDIDENSIHFRLDDDDAIGHDLIANLRKMAARADGHTLLTLPRGFHLFSDLLPWESSFMS